jgi:hypothetical protein
MFVHAKEDHFRFDHDELLCVGHYRFTTLLEL